MNKLSVIICTHNPKQEYLSRVIQGLKKQTLDYSSWELIIVDNASEKSIEEQLDISWHPNGRFVFEDKLGLIHARLKGISEAKGDLFVFFDDDNVPNSDYLEKALQIEVECPFIGAFGGSNIGEFESPPPTWMQSKLSMLAVREIERTIWSNLYKWETTPAGAGMIIRSIIAKKYVQNTLNNPLKQLLGRKGTNTASAEDVDMAFTAIDMGYGCGLFSELKLLHIIPKERVKEAYLIRLYEGIITSQFILDSLRGNYKELPKQNIIQKLLLGIFYYLFKSKIELKLHKVRKRSRQKLNDILGSNNPRK